MRALVVSLRACTCHLPLTVAHGSEILAEQPARQASLACLLLNLLSTGSPITRTGLLSQAHEESTFSAIKQLLIYQAPPHLRVPVLFPYKF